jgi:hypothetical protein
VRWCVGVSVDWCVCVCLCVNMLVHWCVCALVPQCVVCQCISVKRWSVEHQLVCGRVKVLACRSVSRNH